MYSLPAIGHFIDDRLAFQQEHRRGLYTTPSYFLATQLAELPALCSVTLCLSVTLYSLCGLYPGRLGMFLAIAWLVLAVGFAACQLIAAAYLRALGFDTGAGVVERDVGALAAIFLVTRLLTLAVLHARRGQRR